MRAVLLFVVVAVFLFLGVNSVARDPKEVLSIELALTWTVRMLGGLIAAIAAFALLMRGLGGETLERQYGFAMPLLAGLALMWQHWMPVAALGLLGVALILRHGLHRPPYPTEPPPLPPPG
jgi:hypothetical protein